MANANDCPEVGQSCNLGQAPHVCSQGCTSDDQCKINRPDTNGNGTFDPYNPTDNPDGDHLVYDTTTNGTCNPVTFRCNFEPRAGTSPEAGDACSGSFDCEANGTCFLWGASGYCSKIGCGVSGIDCAGGGICHNRPALRYSFDFCGVGCTVAAEDGMAYEVGVDGHGEGCPAGLACEWNGADSTGTNGVCVAGNYNDVADYNVASPCADHAECYSPFGNGFCLPGSIFGNTANNYCSIMDCSAPGLPTDICGAGGRCITLFTDFTMCVKDCTSADQCAPGHGCVALTSGAAKVCFPSCEANADCRTGETCAIPTGATTGQCQPSA
jgi:hypothetical protein